MDTASSYKAPIWSCPMGEPALSMFENTKLSYRSAIATRAIAAYRYARARSVGSVSIPAWFSESSVETASSASQRPCAIKGYAASLNSLYGSVMVPWSSCRQASREPLHSSSSLATE
jgi:hypothetical protein